MWSGDNGHSSLSKDDNCQSLSYLMARRIHSIPLTHFCRGRVGTGGNHKCRTYALFDKTCHRRALHSASGSDTTNMADEFELRLRHWTEQAGCGPRVGGCLHMPYSFATSVCPSVCLSVCLSAV
ncbi:hypothetical protein EVAR_74901_1 [Eumeta japonica]|uniref:Uncharacterized protein n=1 Tax=Eumeta variegata TaxID=151549 RepID=A0A4C1UII2_EUMVA|nr:hypothetical protein EVAR_74901_1 [Eumeta japonica]